ncbi:MAG TPA: hypothetical protein VGR28_13820 [Candidatus Thermoplasmatota archaeon]|jgi:O-antigen/teichoic acid export membrane protein|nr:hypothetical protein [Candidatus Thermoplasmatota archaeon]
MPRMLPDLLRRALAPFASHRQARDGNYLMLNAIVGAGAGVAFWIAVVRAFAFTPAEVGVGVAVISLATALALVSKLGLDAALVRHVPRAGYRRSLRLLALATALGALAAVAGAALVVGGAGAFVDLGVPRAAWGAGLIALLAALLVVTWLQDAVFLAVGEARRIFHRNLVLHGARLLTPGLLAALALPLAVPLAWGLAVGLSALAGLVMLRALPRAPAAAPTAAVPTRTFLRSAARNMAGSGAEFVPALLLPPLVLHLHGPEAAAPFGLAWAAASVLYLLSAALARSAFAEMSRGGAEAKALRHAVRHHLAAVAPALVAAMVLGPWALRFLGEGYAAAGVGVFWLLAASTVLVAPVHLYLALLRSREARWELTVFPAVLVVALLSLAPVMGARFGGEGVALAWVVVHVPLAAYAALRLHRAAQEVKLAREPSAHRGGAHLE